jgi:hypothetical protein
MQAYLHRLLVFMNSLYSTSTGHACIVRIVVNLVFPAVRDATGLLTGRLWIQLLYSSFSYNS